MNGLQERSDQSGGVDRPMDAFMAAMQALALKKGGQCLTRDFAGNGGRLKWRCREGHEWESLPLNIKSGHWCPKCGRKNMAEKKRRNGLAKLKNFVRRKRGQVLSPDGDYKNTAGKIRFRCDKGHEWETRPAVIKGGHWCPFCMKKGRKKYDVSVLKELAAKHGGELLSPENMGFKVKHLWQCAKGHTWEAFPWAVKRGNWCPRCAKRGRPPGSRNKSKGTQAPAGCCGCAPGQGLQRDSPGIHPEKTQQPFL